MRPVQVAAVWLLQLSVEQQFMIVVWPPCDLYDDELCAPIKQSKHLLIPKYLN